jgi:hypothetical protein
VIRILYSSVSHRVIDLFHKGETQVALMIHDANDNDVGYVLDGESLKLRAALKFLQRIVNSREAVVQEPYVPKEWSGKTSHEFTIDLSNGYQEYVTCDVEVTWDAAAEIWRLEVSDATVLAIGYEEICTQFFGNA